ncbi:MAG: ABC transporter permease [Deltaproteobacteria bacterium]|nr:ABC transporter permease [Deltaproteobacteria bacterium]
MRGILLVARRDFAAYVNTIWGWVILAIALLIDGVFFNAWGLSNTPQYSAEVLERFFYITGGVTLIAGVFITMRLFAEERQTGTIVLLESSPLSDRDLVIGKYLSAMFFLVFFAALTLYMPALIMVNGKISGEEIGVGYLGVLLMGSAGVAIGTWASSVSRNQILAGAIAAVGTVFFVACWLLARVTDPPFKALISYVAFFDKQFKPFQEGRVNTEAVFFFASVSFAFLLLATQALRARRWE